MKQHYSEYSTEHQQVWKLLFDRQMANLQDKACSSYLENMAKMQAALHSHAIADFNDLDKTLMQETGWQIHVVPGLIPAEDFLAFLAQRKFSSSTWLRRMHQLDYLEEPDMFHDIFGHVPLLMDAEYAAFMQKLGELGVQYADNATAIAILERYYWFTIEFGLIKERDATKIYGAGIISSFGEANSIFNSNTIIHPFCLDQILAHSFVKSDMQQEYFEIASFKQLYDSLEEVAARLKSLAKPVTRIPGLTL